MKIKSGKIDRIPSTYSDELFKVIQTMMHLDKERRPSVEDLLVHPKISQFLKEAHLKESFTAIKRKEEDLLKKEKQIKEKEQDLEK
jgi:hypothetical protein